MGNLKDYLVPEPGTSMEDMYEDHLLDKIMNLQSEVNMLQSFLSEKALQKEYLNYEKISLSNIKVSDR